MKKILTLVLLLIPLGTFAQYETEYTVAKDGSGDFETIQAAVDACKAFPWERITIHVKKGVYKEKVKVHAWNTNLSIIGEDKANTIITWDDYFDRIDRGRNSTFFTATFEVEANDFFMANLTIENTAGEVGQAIALHIDADRCVIRNCDVKGNQDTVYLAGEGHRQYFDHCYIDGTTDYIFGEATAVFKNCTIHTKKNSYITAASTPEGIEFGFVFLDCTLTASESVDKVYLGRPWRDHAKTVFIRCDLGDFIRREGWHNWGSEAKEKTSFYAEGNNVGKGADASDRVEWSHQLSKKQIAKYTEAKILCSPLDNPSKEKWYELSKP